MCLLLGDWIYYMCIRSVCVCLIFGAKANITNLSLRFWFLVKAVVLQGWVFCLYVLEILIRQCIPVVLWEKVETNGISCNGLVLVCCVCVSICLPAGARVCIGYRP